MRFVKEQNESKISKILQPPRLTLYVHRVFFVLFIIIFLWISSCAPTPIASNGTNNPPLHSHLTPTAVNSLPHTVSNPTDAGSWFSFGKMHFKDRKYDAAARSFRQAIKMGLAEPEEKQARDMLGWSYYKMGEYDRAIRVFHKALELFPHWSKALIGRACAYRQKGEHEKAIAEFDRILSLYPNNLTALDNRGWTYYQFKDFERALSDFAKAETLSRSYPALRSNVLSGQGWCYYMNGDFKTALVKFEEAVHTAPPNYVYGLWDAYRGMAFSSAALGDFDSSYKLISKAKSAMDYDPNRDLAVLHYAAGDRKGVWHYLGRTGYVGVSLQVVSIKGVEILYVAEVDTNGPASRAGIIPGDIISGVEGKPVTDLDSFEKPIKSAEPGTRINLTVSRNGVDREFTVIIQDATMLIANDPLLAPISR